MLPYANRSLGVLQNNGLETGKRMGSKFFRSTSAFCSRISSVKLLDWILAEVL